MEVVVETFQDYAYYYNSFYKDKDYRSEAKTVDKLLKKYNPKIKSIINLGCGTGSHDLELARLGYQCHGIDMSRLMINIAEKNSISDKVNTEFEVADIRNYTSKKKYDAVISLFHVISYQNSNQDVLDTFRSARELLSTNGYFLFDVWYGPGVLSDKPCVRVKEVADAQNRLIRIAKPVMHDKENVVDVNYEVLIINKETNIVRTINETHTMRYFFRPELEILLGNAHFELIENIDCQTLAETNYGSWTSYFIAKAI